MVLFGLSVSFAQQKYKAVYTMQVDKERMEHFMKEGSDNRYINAIYKSSNGAQFSLTFDTANALFQLNDKLNVHEMKAKLVSGFLVFFHLSGTIYSDLDKGKSYQLREAGSATHLLALPLEGINWNIITESKMHGKYKVYKATAILKEKRNLHLTAWFCKDVPTKFGPGVYAGLPGLIMDLTGDQQTKGGLKFNLKLDTLTKVNEDITIPFDTYKVCNQQESDEIYGKLIDNGRP
ncbi:GLPGLI family protein [Neptunitalea chrysea]|uniref:GLPGLI family protein n=2 Tax=Neptunitalea chrysea TaxID=1647581 RepID=A0A9W6B5T6_9FLAO|nr:GLPGLI family protein [Neptunitalea chrysea]